MLDLLVTVIVLLAAHATIVLDIATGEILADVIVPLDVLGGEIAVPLGIDLVKIPMRGGCMLHIHPAGII
jgi:hypothetical protein